MDKIDKLIEEGLENWAKNNKLAAGLGAGALGVGAFGLNQYLGADQPMVDKTEAINKDFNHYAERLGNITNDRLADADKITDGIRQKIKDITDSNEKPLEAFSIPAYAGDYDFIHDQKTDLENETIGRFESLENDRNDLLAKQNSDNYRINNSNDKHLKNSKIAGMGAGALGMGATAAALANRNKKQ